MFGGSVADVMCMFWRELEIWIIDVDFGSLDVNYGLLIGFGILTRFGYCYTRVCDSAGEFEFIFSKEKLL